MQSKRESANAKNRVENYTKGVLAVESFFAVWAVVRIGRLAATNVIAFFFFVLCGYAVIFASVFGLAKR